MQVAECENQGELGYDLVIMIRKPYELLYTLRNIDLYSYFCDLLLIRAMTATISELKY